MYTVKEKTRNGQEVKCKSYDDAKQKALEIKKETGNDCNVISGYYAVWTTETESNTDAIYFM